MAQEPCQCSMPWPTSWKKKAPVKSPDIQEILKYWPNVIGYFRVILAISSITAPGDASKLSCVLYLLNCCLDFFDGPVARKLNQCSTFGALLDVTTDITSKQ